MKKAKKKPICKQLEARVAQQFAALIVKEASRSTDRDVSRKQRIPAPSGQAMIF